MHNFSSLGTDCIYYVVKECGVWSIVFVRGPILMLCYVMLSYVRYSYFCLL